MAELHGDLEALLAEAQRRAEQRALERETAADRRAEEMLAGADEAAAQTLDERRAHTQAESSTLRERLLARGDMAVQRAMLTHREALLDRVWEAAWAGLQARANVPERYLTALRSLARLAARTLRAPDIELASDARGHALLTPERLAAWGRDDGVRYTAAAGPIDIAGGLEARAGRLRFDGTFATRLQQARTALREDVAARLLSGLDGDAAGRDGNAAP